jgi:hypothetical protein
MAAEVAEEEEDFVAEAVDADDFGSASTGEANSETR